MCPGSSRVGAATRGASEAAREPEEARGAVEAAREPEEVRGAVEAARGEVESWEGEEGPLGVMEKASSCCSSTGRSTANLCTPISMVSRALGVYRGPWSALWRGRKETVRVRTTP